MTALAPPTPLQSAPATSAAAAAWREEPSHYSWRREVPMTAGVGRRGLAFAVDALVVVFLTYLVTFALAGVGLLTLPSVSLAGGLGDENLGFLWLATLLELPVNVVYFTLLEGATGRTLGKTLMGLRVVSLKGHAIGHFDAFLRTLLRLLWMTPFGPAFIVVDAYVIHSTEMEQRLGDLAAGTLVVVEHPR